MNKRNVWYPYKKELWADQELPRSKKYVLLRVENNDSYFPDPICVGYLKFGAGDKNSPYFVRPGMDGYADVIEWNDCLPKNFEYVGKV